MDKKDFPPVSIESINLAIGERTLQLSMPEARRLHSALEEVFRPPVHLCGCQRSPSWYVYQTTSSGACLGVN
jgi:hypothetical protein